MTQPEGGAQDIVIGERMEHSERIFNQAEKFAPGENQTRDLKVLLRSF
jgi:hypothetical protein